MKNIWFIRMDKQDGEAFFEENSSSVIFSDHGICNPEKERVYKKYRSDVFPSLKLTRAKLAKEVRNTKEELIKEQLERTGFSDLQSKQRCDLVICYWISEMNIGDLVFVRTKQQRVFLCEITSYICERCFSGLGSFSRSVTVHKEITEEMVHEYLWGRTSGRKTVERNAKPYIREMVMEFVEKHHIVPS